MGASVLGKLPQEVGLRSNKDNVLWAFQPSNEESTLAIAEAVEAFEVLSNGELSFKRRFDSEKKIAPSRTQSYEDAKSDQAKATLPEGHPPTNTEDRERSGCPFAAMVSQKEPRNSRNAGFSKQRPESLPTPPTTQERFMGQSQPNASQDGNMSPPPSISGSASKCPIRMLDERSPEEVAEYFETHKHEIPRSHELCVKRYQTNTESIRQLDAKYGSLVNVLQGLGMKHQPLLPAKEREEDIAEMDAKSARKVQQWAGNVKGISNAQASASQDLLDSSIVDTEERQGHFDRPLKEIRVGESPSRPLGISVPGAGPFKESDESETKSTPKVAASKTSGQPQKGKASDEPSEAGGNDRPPVTFNGPVFIGYDAGQAATLIQKCGWAPPGPMKGQA